MIGYFIRFILLVIGAGILLGAIILSFWNPTDSLRW